MKDSDKLKLMLLAWNYHNQTQGNFNIIYLYLPTAGTYIFVRTITAVYNIYTYSYTNRPHSHSLVYITHIPIPPYQLFNRQDNIDKSIINSTIFSK